MVISNSITSIPSTSHTPSQTESKTTNAQSGVPSHQQRPSGEVPPIYASRRRLSLPAAISKWPGMPKVGNAKYPGQPYRLALPDSSNGGIRAGVTMLAALTRQFAVPVQMTLVLDHANAPYGEKTIGQLTELVGHLLSIGTQIGGIFKINGQECKSWFHSNAMACNTACVTFQPSGHLDPFQVAGAPVENLIENTARMIARSGGEKPVVLSTEATAKDDTYATRIHAAAVEFKEKGLINNLPEVIRIGAGDRTNEPGKDWATGINEMRHLRLDKSAEEFTKDQAYVQEQVNKYVDQIPDDATAVVLCCTHFKEWEPYILKRVRENRESKGLPVPPIIDPILVQMNAVVKTMLQIERPASELESEVSWDTSPIVVSSGSEEIVGPSVEHMLNGNLEALELPRAKRTMYGVPFADFPVEEYKALAKPQLEPDSRESFQNGARRFSEGLQLPASTSVIATSSTSRLGATESRSTSNQPPLRNTHPIYNSRRRLSIPSPKSAWPEENDPAAGEKLAAPAEAVDGRPDQKKE